ncbi:hypothetical protein [Arthrobacter sp. NPDC057259]|uniref:hypothetical protein n=1 Tax=Arthrobacter sp. NPDC057259 TaxID=3346073 RepID=UPI003641B5F0
MGTFRNSVDTRAVRFAIGFPLVLAAAFTVCAFLIRSRLPEPLAVRWSADGAENFAPFAAVVGVGAAMIVLTGWAVLLQAAPLTRPAVMRRIMMGAGLGLSLFVTAVLAAVLVGQIGLSDARASHVDVTILAMGSGAALGLGVVMGFVFKADERWSVDDERAARAALEHIRDPDLARDDVRLWVHARSSIFVMLGISTLFPAALLSVALPWLAAVLTAAALAATLFLFARVKVDRAGLRVLAAGLLPVLTVPAAEIGSAAPELVRAAERGGWGFRRHGRDSSMLVANGPAVVVRRLDGGTVTVSAGGPASADNVAQTLTRVASRARGDGAPPRP